MKGAHTRITRAWSLVAVSLPFLSLAQAQVSPSESRLRQVSQGFEARRDQVLESQVRSPYPNPECKNSEVADNACIWGKLDFALAALSLNVENRRANASVHDAVQLLARGLQTTEGGTTKPVTAESEPSDFHFLSPMLLFRIYELFSNGSSTATGRLEPETQQSIEALFWSYAHGSCKIADAQPANLWRVWGSENHGAMKNGTCWSAAQIFLQSATYKGRLYDDGSSASKQAADWDAFLKGSIRQHATRGMLVEIFSPTYSSYTLQNFYNYADFSHDTELRMLARNFIDLWFADWAEEQIDGMHGGSKARAYPSKAPTSTPLQGIQWLYLAVGSPKGMQAPPLMNMLTSTYRMPLVIMDIATDVAGRGVYSAESRRAGLEAKPDVEGWYTVDPGGGIYRYTYCTPTFIMGSSMFAKLPHSAWTAISDQNRWEGILLNDGAGSRIYALPSAPHRDRAYNQFWSVQSKATQIVQKLPEPFSSKAGGMQVRVPKELARTEEAGWVFIDSSAYVAVRPAYGGYTWDPNDRSSMVPDEDLAPVILQAAEKSEFVSIAAFRKAVEALPLHASAESLQFRGLHDAGTFTFYLKSTQLPTVNDLPINLKPSFAFKSPFLNASWASGAVTIQKGSRRLTLDFK